MPLVSAQHTKDHRKSLPILESSDSKTMTESTEFSDSDLVLSAAMSKSYSLKLESQSEEEGGDWLLLPVCSAVIGHRLPLANLCRVSNCIGFFFFFFFFDCLGFFCWFFGGRKDGNVLFNDALNTFYLRLYGVRYMVQDHSDSEKGNPLPPHRLLFPISTIPQTG